MPSINVSNTLSNPSVATQSVAATKSAPGEPAATPTKSAATLKEDTVTVSLAAQAKLLHRQGLSIATIAATLGTNVTSIDGLLGIQVAKSAAENATASSPASNEAGASTPRASNASPGSTPQPQAATAAKSGA